MNHRQVTCDIGTMGTLVLREVLLQVRPSVPSIALALGRSKSTVHAHLRRLRREGLVFWDDGTAGTLRPLVAVVPVGAPEVAR